ncbi:MAG: pilus assembly protein [Selenomonadaceae bacterium]|nr:pilus assembly protein [Selenomonadaceae bacterium]
MKRQQGQSAVEFALIVPLVCLLIFGGIYGGIMFIDYLNFCNEARTVARQIAVASKKAEAIAPYLNGTKAGVSSFDSFYKVTMTAVFIKEDGTEQPASEGAEDVKVTVNFTRDNKDLPWIVYKVGFPPENFKIVYRMKLEGTVDSGS